MSQPLLSASLQQNHAYEPSDVDNMQDMSLISGKAALEGLGPLRSESSR